MNNDQDDLIEINKNLVPSERNHTFFADEYTCFTRFKDDIEDWVSDTLKQTSYSLTTLEDIISKVYYIQKYFLIVEACLAMFSRWLREANGNSRKRLLKKACYGSIVPPQYDQPLKILVQSCNPDAYINSNFYTNLDIEISFPGNHKLLHMSTIDLQRGNIELVIKDNNDGKTYNIIDIEDLSDVLVNLITY